MSALSLMTAPDSRVMQVKAALKRSAETLAFEDAAKLLVAAIKWAKSTYAEGTCMATAMVLPTAG